MDVGLLIEILGWVGVVAVVAAYALVSTRKLDGDGVPYQVLNVVGGALLIVNSFYYGAMPSVVVNVVWIIIGLFALTRVWVRRRDLKIDP